MADIQHRPVDQFYSDEADSYHEQYRAEAVAILKEYPANWFRLRLILDRLRDVSAELVFDAGLGEGTPLVRVARQVRATRVAGFDYTAEMVAQARANVARYGFDVDHIIQADLTRPESYRSLVGTIPADLALCLGVMPHVPDDLPVLRGLREMLRPGGRVFVSFRNSLFSLFTMNRYSHEFIVEHLLAPVSEAIRSAVSEDLGRRFAMDIPPPRTTGKKGGVGYDLLLARFHNPLEMPDLFQQAGFERVTAHYYHYHPAPPMLNGVTVAEKVFREAAIALEGGGDWRGMFLCSAFVVEAFAS